jgi:hypothetical protein
VPPEIAQSPGFLAQYVFTLASRKFFSPAKMIPAAADEFLAFKKKEKVKS